MICIHGLTPHQRDNLGRYFGTIRARPAILLRCYYFWNFSSGYPSVPIWEHSMENLGIKKLGRLFPKTCLGLFTLVIWLYSVYFGCLFTKCGFYHVIWKFPVIFQKSRFSNSISIGKTHLFGKVCTEFHKLIPLRHVLRKNIFPSISTFSIKPNFTMFPYTELYADFVGDPPYVPIWEQIFEWFFSANKQSHSIDVFSWWDCLFTWLQNVRFGILKKLSTIFMVMWFQYDPENEHFDNFWKYFSLWKCHFKIKNLGYFICLTFRLFIYNKFLRSKRWPHEITPIFHHVPMWERTADYG